MLCCRVPELQQSIATKAIRLIIHKGQMLFLHDFSIMNYRTWKKLIYTMGLSRKLRPFYKCILMFTTFAALFILLEISEDQESLEVDKQLPDIRQNSEIENCWSFILSKKSLYIRSQNIRTLSLFLILSKNICLNAK